MKHLIIGGAGFIGSNLASALLSRNESVAIFDNLSRDGSRHNLSWLQSQYPSLQFIEGDVTLDLDKLADVVSQADRVYHLAAQVAVTTSVMNPRLDFQVNALGTFNVLEALRTRGQKHTVLIYSSTNKVYGGMEDVAIDESDTRYSYRDFAGISESRSLDFHSPYGCSKGCGDQYVRDYARIYGLNTIVFRQSCIYGPRQFGVEDQGWVAWFIIALLTGRKLTIYGNGKQVRDILCVDDLVAAYLAAAEHIDVTRGREFNIGGGPANSISVWFDFKTILEKLSGKTIDVTFSDWRPGDQKIFVSDITLAQTTFGWTPQINPETGIKKLYDWVSSNLSLFSHE